MSTTVEEGTKTRGDRGGSLGFARNLGLVIALVLVCVVGVITAGDRFASTALQAWLYRLAHNRLIDHYRQAGPAPLLPLDEAAPAAEDVPGAAAQAAERAGVRAALRRLTAEQQQIITLRFGEGLSAPAVAAALGKPETAIRAMQHRALAALRRLLREDDHDH